MLYIQEIFSLVRQSSNRKNAPLLMVYANRLKNIDFLLQNEMKIFLKRNYIEIQMLRCMKKCLYTVKYTIRVK